LTRYPVNLFRDDEIKALIRTHIHKCLTTCVKSGLKSDSLPEIGKFSSKGTITQGIVSVPSSTHPANFGFKEGKTQTVDMMTLFKLEKGSNALKKYQAGPSVSGGKVKAVGGAKSNKRTSKMANKSSGGDVKKIADKISKFTPGGQSTAAKRSAQRILTGKTPTMPSPGAGS